VLALAWVLAPAYSPRVRRLCLGFALIAATWAYPAGAEEIGTSGPIAASTSTPGATPLRDTKPNVPEPMFPLREDGVLFHAKIAMSGGYGWGSKLVGYGSRERYTGGSATLDVEVVNLPWKHAGIELALHTGYAGSGVVTSTNSRPDNFGRLDVAFDAVAFRAPSYALLFGAGLGGDVNERYWFGGLRGYPFTIVRARASYAHAQAFHASWQFVPASLAARSTVEHRFTLDWSHDMFTAGVRFAWMKLEGGTPMRTYADLEAGLSVGVVIW
jgi:hypothetical protein